MKTLFIKTSYLFAFLLFSNLCLSQPRHKKVNKRAAYINQLIANINKHPDNLHNHELYIDADWLNDSSLQHHYKIWMQQFPDLINIPFALGSAYYRNERPEAGYYLLKAIAIDSSRADIWEMLSTEASIAGDKIKSVEYIKKATLLEPGNADYAFYYADSFKDADTTKYRSMVFDIVKRFPGNIRAAQALYLLAHDSKDTLTKINLFERLYSEYGLKNDWSSEGANWLYSLYLETSPEKALSMCDAHNWAVRKTQAEQIILINNLITRKNYSQALNLIDSIQNIKLLNSADFLTYKKAELYDLMGNDNLAYDMLILKMTKSPSYKLHDLLLKYAQKAGKSEGDMNNDIWKYLDKNSTIAPVFSSKLYIEDKRVSLKDYRGKVILLTFWFPACGPCRAEFPHFEKVMKNFGRQQVAYLGVNSFPGQDKNVLSVVEKEKISFTPLHGTHEVAEKLYKFYGYPSNFLIDQQGRIIFSNFYIGDDNEDTLELMINEILNKDKSVQPRLIADTMKNK